MILSMCEMKKWEYLILLGAEEILEARGIAEGFSQLVLLFLAEIFVLVFSPREDSRRFRSGFLRSGRREEGRDLLVEWGRWGAPFLPAAGAPARCIPGLCLDKLLLQVVHHRPDFILYFDQQVLDLSTFFHACLLHRSCQKFEVLLRVDAIVARNLDSAALFLVDSPKGLVAISWKSPASAKACGCWLAAGCASWPCLGIL